MASGAKYIVLNRKTDWERDSIIKNFKCDKDLLISSHCINDSSVYIPPVFDSMESGTVWHRLRLNAQILSGVNYKIRVYAADTPEILIPIPGKEGRSKVDINQYMKNESMDIARKVDVFEYIDGKVFENCYDIPLYGLSGRYLWLCLEVFSCDGGDMKISSMKIEFPQKSFVDYLPEIYRENQKKDSFFQRFMAIFQSIYVDLEEKIDYTPVKFDIDRASKEFLVWIADWLSIKDMSIWGEEKLRKLIKDAVKIYKMKGTKRAISKIVQEYSGIEPIIVEQFDVKNNMYYETNREIVENLFGDNGYTFTVMLPGGYIKNSERYIELLRVINSVKPIDSVCNLVALNDQIYLDYHCYMGINSFITSNEDLVIGRDKTDVNNLVVSNSMK